ncbi:MAG: aspartate/glutamate racemase family protein [Clostridia bacterium]|nr:aspartate/glutamate racemase family protein [Clostridia bacterium]
MADKTLGILGGLGPLATVYFMDLIVKLTGAEKDQDHISMVVFNHAAIPDRTDFILDSTKPNPLPMMIEDAKKLQMSGADYVVMPCNTAHFFYEQIQRNISIPMLNIIEETVRYAVENTPDIKKLGILATKGTITAGAYQHMCEKFGIDWAVPTLADEQSLMNIIYNQVKAGKDININEFVRIINNMKADGCDAVALGCTELSVINKDFALNRDDVIDSLEVLAKKSILLCGKKVR